MATQLLEKLMKSDLDIYFRGSFVLDLFCQDHDLKTRMNSSTIDILITKKDIFSLLKMIMNVAPVNKVSEYPEVYVVHTNIYTFRFEEITTRSLDDNPLIQLMTWYSPKRGYLDMSDDKIKFIVGLERDNKLYIHSGFIESIENIREFIKIKDRYDKLSFADLDEQSAYIRLVNSNSYRKINNEIKWTHCTR